MVSARAIRRTRRGSAAALNPSRKVAAIQVFVTKLDQFLGTELFAADQPIIIGRHREAHLRLATDNVSREHVRLSLEDGVLFVEDLGSANGTLLNRKRLNGKHEVKASDTLQLGPYSLRLRALLPVMDRAGSAISEADTKVDAVLSAHGSQSTEDESIDVASAIDWRIYEEAIRRATGTEPAKNVIHLKRSDTVTRLLQPMDEDPSTTAESLESPVTLESTAATDASDGSEQQMTARGETGAAFLALLRSTSKKNEEPAMDFSVGSRLAELERMVDRMGSAVEDSQRETTKPERRVSSLKPLHEDELLWSEADEVVEMSAFSDAFAIVPQQSMLRERDAMEANTVSREETTNPTDVRIDAERRYDSFPMSMEAIARSLAQPAGKHERAPRIPAQLVTPSGGTRSASLPPPPPRASSVSPPLVRRVASVVISDEILKNGGLDELSGLKPIPLSRVKVPSEPAPARTVKKDPTGGVAVAAVARGASSISTGAGFAAAQGLPVAPAQKKPSTIPPPPPPPPSQRVSKVPPPPKLKPIAVQIPTANTGPRVTLSPPESQRGSGRVKVSALKPSMVPAALSVPSEHTLTEPLESADMLFDGVEITARQGEHLLDIAQLRKDGDQYVLGHSTPQGARAPASAHTGLRLLRIDANRNVDLVFPREVGGQLVRNGEIMTLHELTENRKYSCLRLKARDVVTVMLGTGPSAVSYHIRFTRAPRSISAIRERAASRAR